MGLLAVSQGLAVPDGLARDLAESDPKDLAQIALVNHVHTVVGQAFERAPELGDHVPRDFLVYLAEMAQANAGRNRALMDQLALIGGAFARAGIPAVALKGSAELLAPTYPDPARRFISDTDILVPETCIEDALACLTDLGGTHVPDDKDFMHHLPPVMLPDGVAPIELHLRIGNDLTDRMLPANRVLAHALPHDCGLSVPDPATRLTHLIVHGQIHHDHHALRALSLRDCLDFHWMRRRFGPEALEQTRATFAEAGQSTVFEGFVAISNVVLGTPATPVDPSATRWARATLAAFGQPGCRRLRETVKWALTCLWRFVSSSEYRRYYLGVLSDRRKLRRVLGNLRGRRRRVQ